MRHETSIWPSIDMAALRTEHLGRAQRISRALVNLQAIDACLVNTLAHEDEQQLRRRLSPGVTLTTSHGFQRQNSARSFTLVGRLLRTIPDAVELTAGPEAIEFQTYGSKVRTYALADMIEQGIPSGFEVLAAKGKNYFVDEQVRQAVEATVDPIG